MDKGEGIEDDDDGGYEEAEYAKEDKNWDNCIVLRILCAV